MAFCDGRCKLAKSKASNAPHGETPHASQHGEGARVRIHMSNSSRDVHGHLASTRLRANLKPFRNHLYTSGNPLGGIRRAYEINMTIAITISLFTTTTTTTTTTTITTIIITLTTFGGYIGIIFLEHPGRVTKGAQPKRPSTTRLGAGRSQNAG